MKSAKKYNTPVGRFIYAHSSPHYYGLGIKSVSLPAKQKVLIASPEKALCDRIIMTSGILLRSTKQVNEFLLEDLRTDESFLLRLQVEEIKSWIPFAPKSSSLKMFVKFLENL